MQGEATEFFVAMTKPTHVPPYLTQEQVDALPHGTEIVVTWSGGNGPAEYTVASVPGPANRRLGLPARFRWT